MQSVLIALLRTLVKGPASGLWVARPYAAPKYLTSSSVRMRILRGHGYNASGSLPPARETWVQLPTLSFGPLTLEQA